MNYPVSVTSLSTVLQGPPKYAKNTDTMDTNDTNNSNRNSHDDNHDNR